MIYRVLLTFLFLSLLAVFGVWLADHPGRVAIDWLDYRADTSVGALVAAIVLLAVAVSIFWRMARLVWSAPGRIGEFRRRRRERRGYRALAEGFFAAASGEGAVAERRAREARELLPDPRLTLLLAAQVAELGGDIAAAKTSYAALRAQPETELAGLRGLIELARRAGAGAEGLELARRARALKPDLSWPHGAVLDLELRAALWDDAERTLVEAVRKRALEPQRARRLRGAVRHAQSLAAERAGDGARALEFAREAHDCAPASVGPAARHARLLVGAGEAKRARKVVEEAWRAFPHPELVAAYRAARGAPEPIAWAQAVQRLAQLAPKAGESRLALAEAALDARLWGVARDALNALDKSGGDPATAARAMRLGARLAEDEHGDRKAAEALRAAAAAVRDPAWQCATCGATAEQWVAACGNCGAVDTLAWRVPGIAAPSPQI